MYIIVCILTSMWNSLLSERSRAKIETLCFLCYSHMRIFKIWIKQKLIEVTVGMIKEPGKFILFFPNFPYQISAYKQGFKILYPDHPAAQPAPTLWPCHSLLVPNSDQRVQWWGYHVFMGVPILILDLKTDVCITPYWIHIYVTDWS